MYSQSASVFPEDVEQNRAQRLIQFSFEGEELSDIINYVAEERQINIVQPQGPDVIKQKVTFKPDYGHKVTLEQAWKILITFLNFAGYAMSTDGEFYTIVKVDKDTVARHRYPLFISTQPDSLPNTNQHIQYMHFFKNLTVPENYKEGDQDPINQVLSQVLSPSANVLFDKRSNSTIITDQSNNISSAMRILKEFDSSGFQETAEVIPLYNSTAGNIAEILRNISKVADEEKSPFIGDNPRASESVVFPTGTKIIADPRTNSVIVLGRQTAVLRIRNFIAEYIDIPQATGKSILHVYDLQYLDSKEFAPVLNKILSSKLSGSQSESGTIGQTGPERYFQSPIVISEIAEYEERRGEQSGIEPLKTVITEGDAEQRRLKDQVYRGGNRLIVASTNSDWRVIQNLIQELDKPRPQVILEVMIVDFQVSYDKLLGGTTRNRRGTCFTPKNDQVDFLASHLTTPQRVLCDTDEQCENLKTIAGDLLKLSGDNGLVNFFRESGRSGTTLISFNDILGQGVWGVLAILDTFAQTKILNNPYLVTTNNKPAQVAVQETRRILDNPIASGSGAIRTPVINLPASRLVQFLPRISSEERLNLQIRVDINEFTGGSLTRIVRTVETNTNMNSGQVLVIGGLNRTDGADISRRTPIASQVPILGQFFKSTEQFNTNQNLLVLISPTIVQPQLRQGLDLYTGDKIKSTSRDFDSNLVFGTMRDPITRFFFGTRNENDLAIKEYLDGTENEPLFQRMLTEEEKVRQGLSTPSEKEEITLPKNPPENRIRKIKDLLAHEDNPISRVNKSEG
jgi:general secretion pathway protein D